MSSRYLDAMELSARDPNTFWEQAARAIDWIVAPGEIFDPSAGVAGRWFGGGKLNTCYNAVDRHVERGRAGQLALVHDSAVTGAVRSFTFSQLQQEGSWRGFGCPRSIRPRWIAICSTWSLTSHG
jgi:propionyl-CoA synthetase